MKKLSKFMFVIGLISLVFGMVIQLMLGSGGISAINPFVQWSISLFAGSVAASLIAARSV